MEKDKISIIVPIYNTEKYLGECIDSIINQTYKNLEILLIDDGSVDNSAKICDEYQKKDDRIIVIKKKNSGVSGTRNLGIIKSTGDYISFVDSDDTIEPTMIEKLYNSLIKNKTELSFCKFNRLANGIKKPHFEKELRTCDFTEENKYDFVKCFFNKYSTSEDSEYIMGSTCRILFNREFIIVNDLLFYDVTLMEDLLFCLNSFLYINKIAVVNEYLYNYRNHEESACHSVSKSEIDNRLEFIDLLELVINKFHFSDIEKEHILIKAKRTTISACFSTLCQLDLSKEEIKRYIKILRGNTFKEALGVRFSLDTEDLIVSILTLKMYSLLKYYYGHKRK